MCAPKPRSFVGVNRGVVVAIAIADPFPELDDDQARSFRRDIGQEVSTWIESGYDVFTVEGPTPQFHEPWPAAA
jgi:hypothetical protein